MIKKIIVIVLSLFSFYNVKAQSLSSTTEEDKMKWWKDAKFGMFIHWGVYSVPAGIYKGKEIPSVGEWIMNNAKIPVAEYKQYAKQFNPVNYDAEAWVKIAKNAGMKYIVITTKHHDGFALFDSKVSDWNVVDATPYAKDLLRPLVEACRTEGIRIGFYYSQAQDWTHPGGIAAYGHWDKAQDGDMDAYLDSIAVPQVKEILSDYGEPDILWWDSPMSMTAARTGKFVSLLRDHPKMVVNNRLGSGFKGDTETPEQFVPSIGFPGRNWETCMTMNDTWGYKTCDNNWKGSKMLIQNLVNAVSKGGNFLLNVGPTSLGEMPKASIERLDTIGKWLNVNKESVYGTTASPFAYLSWGRCTRKGQKLYLHLFNYPTNGVVGLPMSNKISKAYLLAEPHNLLRVKTANGQSLIIVPKQPTDTMNTVVVVEFTGEPQIKPYPMANKKIAVSSQKDESADAKNLLDGNRDTRWEAAKGERKASLEINLKTPVNISTLIIDEPWHSWENKKQNILLQYKSGKEWKTAFSAQTSGSGHVENFKPVKAQYFRLMVENKDTEPVISEWQLYGPE